MPASPKDRSSPTSLEPIIVFGVMGFVFAVRLAHLVNRVPMLRNVMDRPKRRVL